jgi:hypothetical protein
MVFLAGPPGVGKTSLGSRVCQELGLRFVGLPAATPDLGRAAMETVLRERSADVLELPWTLQLAEGVFRQARQAGRLIGLWAHPLDMQARSGRSAPFITPAPDLERGGYGLRGTRSIEFRRLDRGCEITLMLVRKSFDEALAVLRATLLQVARDAAQDRSPVEQAGIRSWAAGWQRELGAERVAAETLADAIARYILELKAQGASPRALNAVCSDLDAMAWLILTYEAPRGPQVLQGVGEAPWEYEFTRKFSDAPALVVRYGRTTRDFARFLARIGLSEYEE